MAKNKKPKFLEKETPDLLAMLKETLSADDDADLKKASKIVEELISRQPTEEGPISVDEALQAAAASMTEALQNIKAAYDNEVAMMEDSDGDDEPVEEEEEEEGEKTSKESKSGKKSKKDDGKKPKKSKKDEEEEEEEEEEEADDDDDGEDYSDWATKDLKAECRKRGIKVSKGMGKADLVKALEADDKE